MHHLFAAVSFHVSTLRFSQFACKWLRSIIVCCARVIGGGAAGKAWALFRAGWWTRHACESRELKVLKLTPLQEKNVNYVIFTYVPAKTAISNVKVRKFYVTFLAGSFELISNGNWELIF
jgi:hypothetical protein